MIVFPPMQHSQINCQNYSRKKLIINNNFNVDNKVRLMLNNYDKLSVISNVINLISLISKARLNNSSGFIIISGFPTNNTAILRGEI